MPFGSTYTRRKTYAPSGSFAPADWNNLQNDLGYRAQALDVATGTNDASVTRRGKLNLATTSTVTSTGYAYMPLQDIVFNIRVLTDSILWIAYQAIWSSSVANAAKAAIFVSSNVITLDHSLTGGTPPAQEADGPATANRFCPLHTTHFGLAHGGTGASDTTEVSTGQVVGSATALSGIGTLPMGGPVGIFVNPGLVTAGVAFKSTSGSVSVKNRHLWVWVQSF